MILLLIYGPFVLLSIVTLFCGRLFQLAGIDKSNAYKPLLNVFYWLKVTRFRPILGIMFFVPYLNLLFIVGLVTAIVLSYSPRHTVVTIWSSLLWFIWLPVLNKKAEAYIKQDASTMQWNWLAIDVVLFILLKRSIINTFLFSIFAIPTSSMEKTFMAGDLVFAQRIGFGPRLPNTLLSLPFFHNQLPSGKPSYLTDIELPYYRFPGSPIRRNDVLVFNYPMQTQWPTDKRDYYMKRCVALPGDTIQILDAVVSINGVKAYQPPLGQKSYLVKTDGTNLEMDLYTKLDITDGGKYGAEPGVYLLGLTLAARDSLKTLPFVKSIELSIKPKNMVDFQRYFYPADTSIYHWNSDQYGPLVIPKKGVTAPLNKNTFSLYAPLITKYEGHKLVLNGDSTITLDGKPASDYTFSMNYYFMMGDNRDNSEDSRFWGLVPEDHIDSKVWKAFRTPTWMHCQTFGH